MKEKLILILILILAIFFRLNNRNWDNNHHIHPDERFLTMVGTDMKIPSSFSDYLDPSVSTLNPANINYKFFVYGVLPVTLNKALAVYYKNDTYDDFTLQGRLMSGIFDLLIVLLVYKTAKILISLPVSNLKQQLSNVPLWAAFFYAGAVLPIQLSHFFAVDTFLNFFMFASFYFALRFSVSNKKPYSLRFIFLSAIFLGLALGSKITALFILPLNLFFLVSFLFKRKFDKIDWFSIFLLVVFYLLFSYFSLRLANPYMFENTNFFDPKPGKLFIENLNELRSLSTISSTNYFPPNVQWLNKNPVTHSLVNNFVFGLGIVMSGIILIGTVWIILNFKKLIAKNSSNIHNYFLVVVLFWMLSVFAYQSLQANPTLRYFIIFYPFLAIFAAIGVSVISYQLSVLNNKLKINNFYLLTTEYLLLITILLVWPVMFTSIYRNKHSRVEASEWIYKNFKNSSVIANEHWDDGLPFPLANNYNKQFTTLELPIFAPDDEAKWNQINEIFQQVDYYILSSNRGWGSIATVPEKYPKMSKFYADLFSNRLNFKKVAEFTSYPKLCLMASDLCLVINDDWADESFTVYDHPKVMIFKK